MVLIQYWRQQLFFRCLKHCVYWKLSINLFLQCKFLKEKFAKRLIIKIINKNMHRNTMNVKSFESYLKICILMRRVMRKHRQFYGRRLLTANNTLLIFMLLWNIFPPFKRKWWQLKYMQITCFLKKDILKFGLMKFGIIV